MGDLLKAKKEFFKYTEEKLVGSLVLKKFISSINSHIKTHPDSFIEFWKKLKIFYKFPIESSIKKLNRTLKNKEKGYETFHFISEWSNSYLGPGEMISLLLIKESFSGRRKKPDILYRDSNRKIEVKSYLDNFRLSESTYFSTDLGTIIQSLVQGGFLHSLTDLNINDIKKGMNHFAKAFTCPRGYIELNSKIWRLHSSNDESITFKISNETDKELVNYSIVRNSLRNWIGRGVLSIRLASIIDPTRKKRIPTKELVNYIDDLLGSGESLPIPLEQYFIISDLESILIYDRKDNINPFSIYKLKDLKNFRIDRVAQAKVSYKKLKKEETLVYENGIINTNQIKIKMEKNLVKTTKTKKQTPSNSKRTPNPVPNTTPSFRGSKRTPNPVSNTTPKTPRTKTPSNTETVFNYSSTSPLAVTPVTTERTRKVKSPKYKNRNRISVLQLTLKGKRVKKYNSLTEAFNSTGVNVGSISKTVRGITKSAGGYRWEQFN